MTKKDLLVRYNLEEGKLLLLLDCVVSFLEKKGVIITYTDLTSIVETDIYQIEKTVREEDRHHESCISDGVELWLHEDLEDVGGIGGRLYDLLHVGCGHLYQWSANRTSNLKFSGDYAWSIGSAFYLGKSEDEIQTVWEYEGEAGMLALANLRHILKQSRFSKEFSDSCVQFLNDYITTDVEYITSFYRSGEVKNFYEGWQFNSKKLLEINVDFPLNIQRRSNKCIALIGAW